MFEGVFLDGKIFEVNIKCLELDRFGLIVREVFYLFFMENDIVYLFLSIERSIVFIYNYRKNNGVCNLVGENELLIYINKWFR